MEQLLNVDKNQLKSFVKAHVAPDSIQSSNIMKSFNQTYTNNEFLTPQEDFLDEFIDKQIHPVTEEISHKAWQKLFEFMRKREDRWREISRDYYCQNLTLINLLTGETCKSFGWQRDSA